MSAKKRIVITFAVVLTMLTYIAVVFILSFAINKRGEDVAKLERQVRNQSELDRIIQQLNATIGNQSDLLIDYKKKFGAYESKLEGYNLTFTQLDVEGSDVNKTIEEWRRVVGRMTATLNDLNETIQSYQQNISTLDEDLTKLNGSLDELNKNLTDVNESIDQRNKVKDTQSQSVNEQQLLINELNRKVEENRQILIELKAKTDKNVQLLEEKAKQIAKLNKELEVAYGLCSSAGCLSTAIDLSRSMNGDVDPCQDFYRFACGVFPRNYPVPEGLDMWNKFQELDKDTRNLIKGILENGKNGDPEPIKQARKLYSVCVEYGLKPEEISDPNYGLTKWPIKQPSWNTINFDLMNFTSLLRQTFNMSVLFEVGRVNGAISIGPGSLSRDRTSLLNRSETELGAEVVTLVDSLLKMNLTKSQSRNETEDDVRDFLRFESQLANISVPGSPSLMTVAESQREVDRLNLPQIKISLLQYLNLIYNGTGVQVSADETIACDLSYLQQLMKLISDTDERTIVNYVYWRMFKVIDADNQLKSKTKDMKNACVVHVMKSMPYAVSAAYVRKHFNEATRSDVTGLIDQLKNVLVTFIDESDWLDEEARSSWKNKMMGLKYSLGYPDWILNDTALNEYYKGLKISKEGVHNLRKMSVLRELAGSSSVPDPIRELWTGDVMPFTANVLYNHQHNVILLSASVLELSDYSAARYGKIGNLIAREINRAIRDAEDQNADLQQWTQCFVGQFGSDGVDPTQVRQIMADYAGLQVAYQAFNRSVYPTYWWRSKERLPGLEKWTADQIFFVSFAQNYCKSHIMADWPSAGSRVNGALTNFADFSRHFQCSAESPMNSQRKCFVWGANE